MSLPHLPSALLLLAALSGAAVASDSADSDPRPVGFDALTRTPVLFPHSSNGAGAPGKPGAPLPPGGGPSFPFTGPEDGTAPFFAPNCRIVASFPDGTTREGSGTLIDPYWVIASGNLVHPGPGGDWAESVAVSPAWDGDDDLASTESSVWFVSWEAWVEEGDVNHDQAFLKLDRPIGFLSGWRHIQDPVATETVGALTLAMQGFPTGVCFEGAPDQLHGASGLSGWEGVSPTLFSTTDDWPCGMDGLGGASLSWIFGGILATLSSPGVGDDGQDVLLATVVTEQKSIWFAENPATWTTPSELDLTPLKARAEFDVVEAGSSFWVSARVCNPSLESTPFGVGTRMEVVLSTDAVVSDDDLLLGEPTPSLFIGPKDSATFSAFVSVPDDLHPGAYWVGVRVAEPDSNPFNQGMSGWDMDQVDVLDGHPYVDLGCALPGALGEPALVPSGDLTTDSHNAIGLANAAPSRLAALFFSTSESAAPFKGGVLKALSTPAPTLAVTGMVDGLGQLDVAYSVRDDVPAGLEFFVQWVIVDESAVQGYALSNAVMARTQ
jgi:hypothetical protein